MPWEGQEPWRSATRASRAENSEWVLRAHGAIHIKLLNSHGHTVEEEEGHTAGLSGILA
jgi:hypothetical protein